MTQAARPGWTIIAGNPAARVTDGKVYMVEAADGVLHRCVASVFYDEDQDVISFHRVDSGDEVDAVQFVTAIEKESDKDAVRPGAAARRGK